MKKLLLYFMAVACVSAPTGCAQETVDYYHGQVVYVYQNNYSDSITMRTYSPYINHNTNPAKQGTIEKSFGICKGGQIKVYKEVFSPSIPPPLVWDSLGSPIGRDSTIIYLKNKQIVYRAWVADPIYEASEYIFLSGNTLGWTFPMRISPMPKS